MRKEGVGRGCSEKDQENRSKAKKGSEKAACQAGDQKGEIKTSNTERGQMKGRKHLTRKRLAQCISNARPWQAAADLSDSMRYARVSRVIGEESSLQRARG